MVRHAQKPRGKAPPIFPLEIGVVLAARRTLLVPTVRCAPTLDPRPTTTPRPAVPVPAVTRPADRERRPAPPARQQIQDDAGQQPLAQTPLRADGQDARNGGILTASYVPTEEPFVAPSPGRAATRPGLLIRRA